MLKCEVHEREMLLYLFLRYDHAPKIINVAVKMQPVIGEISNDKTGDLLTGSCCSFQVECEADIGEVPLLHVYAHQRPNKPIGSPITNTSQALVRQHLPISI